jgi:hypothetical protein
MFNFNLQKRLRMHKKAFELSATFIVILILTIVIFTSSMYFTRKFFSAAEELKESVDANTEAQIKALLDDGNLVAMPINKITIHRGTHANYGIGIMNVIGAQKDFVISVEFNSAYTLEEEPIEDADGEWIDDKWLLYSNGPHPIQNNDKKTVPIRVTADSAMADGISTQLGIYVFNVCVDYQGDAESFKCDKYSSPSDFYSGKVYRLYVEVT